MSRPGPELFLKTPAGLVIQVCQEQLVPVGQAGLQHIPIRPITQFRILLFYIADQRPPGLKAVQKILIGLLVGNTLRVHLVMVQNFRQNMYCPAPVQNLRKDPYIFIGMPLRKPDLFKHLRPEHFIPDCRPDAFSIRCRCRKQFQPLCDRIYRFTVRHMCA